MPDEKTKKTSNLYEAIKQGIESYGGKGTLSRSSEDELISYIEAAVVKFLVDRFDELCHK